MGTGYGASQSVNAASSFSRAAAQSTTTRKGTGFGGSTSRFREQSSNGHYLSKADRSLRDEQYTAGSSAYHSSFASAMRKGNPRANMMGGSTSRFGGRGSIYKKSVTEAGPGSSSAGSTTAQP